MLDNGKPEDWHVGCATDKPRNEFIIPSIVRQINKYNSNCVGFLGCATGYIPQKVSENCSVDNFELIDIDVQRLEFSKKLDYNKTRVRFFSKPLEQLTGEISVDMLIISNTLLEFKPDVLFYSSLNKVLSKNAKVIIYLPDILKDVVDEYVGGKRLALEQFIDGIREVEKLDKFTLVKTNFYAHRLIILVGNFLTAGFHLTDIEISQTDPVYFSLILSRRV